MENDNGKIIHSGNRKINENSRCKKKIQDEHESERICEENIVHIQNAGSEKYEQSHTLFHEVEHKHFQEGEFEGEHKHFQEGEHEGGYKYFHEGEHERQHIGEQRHFHEEDHGHDYFNEGEHMHDHQHMHDHDHEHMHKHQHKNTKAVLNRLSKATGHLQSVKRMVENGRDCSEVLVQLAAVIAALNSTGRVILEDHINNCIVDAVESGDKKAIEDLNKVIGKFIK